MKTSSAISISPSRVYRTAADLRPLASLSAPRMVPPDLIALPPETEFVHRQVALDTLEIEGPPPTRPEEPVENERNRNLPGFIHVVARTDKELPPPGVALPSHTARVHGLVGEREEPRGVI